MPIVSTHKLNAETLAQIDDLARKLRMNPDRLMEDAQAIFNQTRNPYTLRKKLDRELFQMGKVLYETEFFDKVDRIGKEQIIRQRHQIVGYSKAIIVALQEALDYDPTRHHNRPPPDLRIENPDYLAELKNLVTELKTLNALLENKSLDKKFINGLAKHLNKFLDSYAGAMGKGAAALTTAAIGAMLYRAGVSNVLLGSIWGHLNIPD